MAAGAALGSAALLAALAFSASGHDLSSTTVGSSSPAVPAATVPTNDVVAPAEPIEVAHFNGANAARALAEAEAARQAAELAELAALPDAGSVPVATVDPASVLSSGFIKPVHGAMSSPFGVRFHPILHVWKLHTGTDLAAACGTPVKAAKAGTVTAAGGATGYGNRVIVDHGGGLVTTYNHLTSYAATVGLAVQQGQIIGYVGSTGWSTGCHLHFEVKVNGAFVDPAPYLDIAVTSTVVIPPAVAPRSDTLASATASPSSTTLMPTATSPVSPVSPTSPGTPTSTSSTSAPSTTTIDPTSSTTASPTSTTVPSTTSPTATATATEPASL
jgi:hypothetical protein